MTTGPTSSNGTKTKPEKEKNFVFSLSRTSRCHNCDRKLAPGDIVKLENSRDDKEALCRSCADLNSLELVLKGNAKISRLANKYSTITYIVMKWSDTWKTYERIGILVKPEAVDQAEAEAGVKLPNREKLGKRD